VAILAFMTAIIFFICVVLLNAVVIITAKSINLFKGKKYGQHRFFKGHDNCL
jgi:hypothetical protein